MPEPLWRAAVALCEEHTVHSVAQYLGVGYDRLRRRVVEAELERVRAHAAVSETEFVELRIAPEPPAELSSVVAYEIELQRADGARLVIRSDAALDLHGLTRTFLEGGP
jgi:hypothetical protein